MQGYSHHSSMLSHVMHLLDLNDNADALGAPLPKDKARADLQDKWPAQKLSHPCEKQNRPLHAPKSASPGRLSPGGTRASAGTEIARTPLKTTNVYQRLQLLRGSSHPNIYAGAEAETHCRQIAAAHGPWPPRALPAHMRAHSFTCLHD